MNGRGGGVGGFGMSGPQAAAMAAQSPARDRTESIQLPSVDGGPQVIQGHAGGALSPRARKRDLTGASLTRGSEPVPGPEQDL